MKRFLLPALILGSLLLTVLALHVGLGSVAGALERLGLAGFLLVVAIHLALNQGLGLAWWLLGWDIRPLHYLAYCWARLIRNAASDVLPLSTVGGQVAGGRVMMMAGVDGLFAGVSTVVDVTVEAVMQFTYVALGLALLAMAHLGQGLVAPLAAGAAVMGVFLIGALAILATAPAWAEGLLLRVVKRLPFLGSGSEEAGALLALLRRIFTRPRSVGLAAVVHLLCWSVTGVETWIVLRLMGAEPSLSEGIIIDSLLAALRAFAFFVPNALGVQEGGYIMLCGIFGIPAEIGLALSLTRRARDLVIGLPALLVWQGMEGHLLLRRRRA
jgi:putative membrane protein